MNAITRKYIIYLKYLKNVYLKYITPHFDSDFAKCPSPTERAVVSDILVYTNKAFYLFGNEQ
jgi:hypothetical protein